MQMGLGSEDENFLKLLYLVPIGIRRASDEMYSMS